MEIEKELDFGCADVTAKLLAEFMEGFYFRLSAVCVHRRLDMNSQAVSRLQDEAVSYFLDNVDVIVHHHGIDKLSDHLEVYLWRRTYSFASVMTRCKARIRMGSSQTPTTYAYLDIYILRQGRRRL